MRYTLYQISHPDTLNLVYVGITNSFPRRSKAHLSVNDVNKDKCNWVIDLVSIGKTPLIEPILVELAKEEAIKLEMQLIAELCPIFNLKRKYSDKPRLKISSRFYSIKKVRQSKYQHIYDKYGIV